MYQRPERIEYFKDRFIIPKQKKKTNETLKDIYANVNWYEYYSRVINSLNNIHKEEDEEKEGYESIIVFEN